MNQYKKNCDEEKDYEKQYDNLQSYSEFLFAEKAFKKAKLVEINGFEKMCIDDYFTSIQIISNAILLKKFKIRSKSSVCGYYKLYVEKIITDDIYKKIENIRETRNIVHYNGYEANLIPDNEAKELISNSNVIYLKLKSIYEEL